MSLQKATSAESNLRQTLLAKGKSAPASRIGDDGWLRGSPERLPSSASSESDDLFRPTVCQHCAKNKVECKLHRKFPKVEIMYLCQPCATELTSSLDKYNTINPKGRGSKEHDKQLDTLFESTDHAFETLKKVQPEIKEKVESVTTKVLDMAEKKDPGLGLLRSMRNLLDKYLTRCENIDKILKLPRKSESLKLKSIMAHDDLKSVFNTFLKSQLCNENLEFYDMMREAVDTHSDTARVLKAKTMWDTYIKDDAPKMINVSSKGRAAIKEICELGSVDVDKFTEAFAAADKDVWTNMNGLVPQFTEEYADQLELALRRCVARESIQFKQVKESFVECLKLLATKNDLGNSVPVLAGELVAMVTES